MVKNYSQILIQDGEKEEAMSLSEVLAHLRKLPPTLENALERTSGHTIEECLLLLDSHATQPVFVRYPGDAIWNHNPYHGILREHTIILHPTNDFHALRTVLEKEGYVLDFYPGFTPGAAGYCITAVFKPNTPEVSVRNILGLEVLGPGGYPVTHFKGRYLPPEEVLDPDRFTEFKETIILRQRDLFNPNEWLELNVETGEIRENQEHMIRAMTLGQLEGSR